MLELLHKNVDFVPVEYWVYFCMILYDFWFPWNVEPTTVEHQLFYFCCLSNPAVVSWSYIDCVDGVM